MRVLLPLRKVSANNQSSNASLSDLEHEDHRNSDISDEGSIAKIEQTQTFAAALPQTISNSADDKEFSFPVSSNATSYLKTEIDSRSTRNHPGKRQPLLGPVETDYKVCRKRPALDKKPAARDLKSMVAGGRAWAKRRNGDRRDSPEMKSNDCLVENSPESARGDLPSNVDMDLDFKVALKKQGLEIREQDGDGNCLFRAISLQVYGDPSMHGDVRKQCMDFMERDKEHFSQFVTGEPFNQYLERKRQDGVHGNNPEIQAISELFNRPIEVFCPENGAAPLNIFHAEYKTDDTPIRLSYHDGNHYNAVIDPLVPTAGLGLGLPGLQPGLADKLQMAKAVKESDAAADQMEYERALKNSEDDELQRAIKESKLSAEHMHSNEAMALSDMDATYFELEQAALEHSLNAYPNYEQGKKQKASSERRRQSDQAPPCNPVPTNDDINSSVGPLASFASLPDRSSGSHEARIPPPVAAAASVASVAAVPSPADNEDDRISPNAQYPQTVQELVMNGFELKRVVRAYELIGDNFDDLLSFLMSNNR